jgi:predicted nucleotidyltransferase
MVGIDAVIENRARRALDVLGRSLKIVAAYVFGSQVDGTSDQWSDIDLAVFADGLENWDISTRAKAIATVQEEAGDDIEVHLFSTESLERCDPASFAGWILSCGIELSVK